MGTICNRAQLSRKDRSARPAADGRGSGRRQQTQPLGIPDNYHTMVSDGMEGGEREKSRICYGYIVYGYEELHPLGLALFP